MARRRFSIVPVLMLASGLAIGWWLAKHGVDWPSRAGDRKPAEGRRESPPSAADIRKIDFRNFRYAPECLRNEDGSRGSVTTRDGAYQRNEQFDRVSFTVGEVEYGELTGDAHDDAVVLTSCNTGGTGSFTEGFVYSLDAGRVREIGRIESGSRAFGGIAGLRIHDGVIVVERYATDEDGPHCCPRYIDTTQLRWNGRHFEPVGASARRAAPATN